MAKLAISAPGDNGLDLLASIPVRPIMAFPDSFRCLGDFCLLMLLTSSVAGYAKKLDLSLIVVFSIPPLVLPNFFALAFFLSYVVARLFVTIDGKRACG